MLNQSDCQVTRGVHIYPFGSSDTLLSTQRNEPCAAVERPPSTGRAVGRYRGDAYQEHVRSPWAETPALLPQCNSHCECVYKDFPLNSACATTLAQPAADTPSLR